MSLKGNDEASGSITEVLWWLRGYVREAKRFGWNLSRQVSALIDTFEGQRDLYSFDRADGFQPQRPYQAIGQPHIDFPVTISDDSDEAEAGSLEDLREREQRASQLARRCDARSTVKQEPITAAEDGSVSTGFGGIQAEEHAQCLVERFESEASLEATQIIPPRSCRAIKIETPEKSNNNSSNYTALREDNDNRSTETEGPSSSDFMALAPKAKRSMLTKQDEIISSSRQQTRIKQERRSPLETNGSPLNVLRVSRNAANEAVSSSKRQTSFAPRQLSIKQEKCDETAARHGDPSAEPLATQQLPSPKRRSRSRSATAAAATTQHLPIGETNMDEVDSDNVPLTQLIPPRGEDNRRLLKAVIKQTNEAAVRTTAAAAAAKEDQARTVVLPTESPRRAASSFGDSCKLRNFNASHSPCDQLANRSEFWCAPIPLLTKRRGSADGTAESPIVSPLKKRSSFGNAVDIEEAWDEEADATQALDHERIVGSGGAATSIADLSVVSSDESCFDENDTEQDPSA